jgi:hypothetical protein
MFEGGWEIFGVGTIYPGEDGPHIHYHASVGRSGHALTGCLREKAITYLIVEAVIMEFTGLTARKEFDEKMQLHLPVLGQKTAAAEKQPGDGTSGAEGEKNTGPFEKEKSDELPGGLAEIIRDLTRRPSG